MVENTDAMLRVGTTCCSDEGSAMGLERRGSALVLIVIAKQ